LVCRECDRSYAVVAGIADLRLGPDRYVSIDNDRLKALRVVKLSGGEFDRALEVYWELTPEVEPILAAGYLARQRSEAAVGTLLWKEIQVARPRAPLLDLGCGVGGLLAAGVNVLGPDAVIGVDAALRWLVVARMLVRSRTGWDPLLICAHAEALPFADSSAGAVCANDLLEHVERPGAALSECARVLRPGARAYLGTNQRYSIAPEPHVRLLGAGWLPRTWQDGYARMRGRDYSRIRLLSGAELRRAARRAELAPGAVAAAPVLAPHRTGMSATMASFYDHVRALPLIGRLVALVAPRIRVVAERRW
jgi:SAM-dependent methyltransferase